MENKKEKLIRLRQNLYGYHISDIFLFIGGLALNFFLIMIGNMSLDFEIAVIVFCLAILVSIVIIIVTTYFHNLVIRNSFNRVLEDTFSQIGNSQFGYAVRAADAIGSCIRHKYHCCVINLIQSDFYKYVLNETEMRTEKLSEYNLISPQNFDEKEKEYFKRHPNGEIWVISNALETEIEIDDERGGRIPDLSLRQSMEVVKKNIENGGKYVQFVSLGVHGEEDTEFLRRRQKYWEAKPDLKSDIDRKKEMPVIRIDSDFKEVGLKRDVLSDPDWAFMVKLTSTIIFIDEMEHLREGYFCFRPEDNNNAEEYERRTVLFEMPSYCMLDAIVKDLKEIKEDYFKNLRGKYGIEKGYAYE